MDEDDVIDLLGYLTRSKAIWKNPALLNLVESAPSPTKAQALVLQNTGKKKTGIAAWYYACAIRDFGKDSLGALTAILNSPQGTEKLEELLTTTPPRYAEGQVKEIVMIIANIPLEIQLGAMLFCGVAGLLIFYAVFRALFQKRSRPQDGFPKSKEKKSVEVPKKTPKILLDELKTCLVKTLRKRDRESQSDSAFWASFSLVAENEELGVVVLREDTNNYGYQKRTGDYSDSNAWENLVVATRKGYCFLGRVNLYQNAGYKEPFHITKSESGSIVVSCNRGTFTIKDEDMTGGYDYPFEMPPRSEMVRTAYNLDDGIIVVIDDDHGQGEYVQSSVYQMGDSLKADQTVWDLPGCVRNVDQAIEYLPNYRGRGQQVKLVLVDGNFSGDGRGFNTGKLIPVLRTLYPNAVLFANSGKGENHANHNLALLRSGCDYALPEEDYGYKSDLPRILERVAEFKPEILLQEELDLKKVLKI